MPPYGPVKRRTFIAALRDLGFDGPFAGGRHEFMVRGSQRVTIPNPHRGDISVGLLRNLLAEAGVSREDWERV